MAFDINQFRSALPYDGARPNIFEVTLNFPQVAQSLNLGTDISTVSRQLTFMAKASQLPGSTLGMIPVHYFGREVKIPGNRTFQDWTITVINDEDFAIREAFETWLASLSGNTSNIRSPNAVNYIQYSSQGLVTQLGKAGNKLKQYLVQGIYPIDITPIDLDWGQNDTIEEFSVTLATQYWE